MAFVRYTPISDFQAFTGKNRIVYDAVDMPEWLDIFLKSTPHSCPCPECGEVSRNAVATYRRTVQDIPFSGKPTVLHMNVYKYRCTNPKCSRNIFTEPLDIVSPHQQRTDAANMLILALAVLLSNEAASLVMSGLGVEVSNDGVQRLIDGVSVTDMPDEEILKLPEYQELGNPDCKAAVYSKSKEGIHLLALVKHRDRADLQESLRGKRKIKSLPRKRIDSLTDELSSVLQNFQRVPSRLDLFEQLLDAAEKVVADEQQQVLWAHKGNGSGTECR